jgi:hypothetical protein
MRITDLRERKPNAAWRRRVSSTQVDVSKAAVGPYGAVQLSAMGGGVALPEGALIVREIPDDAGKIVKLSMLAQCPKGYNPTGGDLWFASTDASGAFLVEKSVPIQGPVASCSGCFAARSQDGFLFGLAQSERARASF